MNNIKLTKEEKAKLIENAQKIRDYLMTLTSRVRKTIDIYIPFEKRIFLRLSEKHALIEYAYGTKGSLEPCYFTVEDSPVYNFIQKDHEDFVLALIDNWKEIKKELLLELDRQNAQIDKLDSFEL